MSFALWTPWRGRSPGENPCNVLTARTDGAADLKFPWDVMCHLYSFLLVSLRFLHSSVMCSWQSVRAFVGAGPHVLHNICGSTPYRLVYRGHKRLHCIIQYIPGKISEHLPSCDQSYTLNRDGKYMDYLLKFFLFFLYLILTSYIFFGPIRTVPDTKYNPDI